MMQGGRWLLVLLGLMLVSASPLPAQVGVIPQRPSTFESPLHKFRDAEGRVVVEGNFLEMKGIKVEIQATDGEKTSILFSILCDEDKEFVREQIKLAKDEEKAAEVIQQAAIEMFSGKAADIVQGSKKIRRLGKLGLPGMSSVQSAMQATDDERARHELFVTFVTITGISESAPQTVFSILERTGNEDILRRVRRQPGDFLDAYATLEDVALPYLKWAAFTGQLIPDAMPPVAPTQPTAFRVNDEDLLRVRAAACSSLANIPGPTSLSAVLDVLKVAEQPVMEKVDEKTIEACLEALGRIGIADEEALEALDRHAEAFPKTVEQARERLKK